ncbi:hypothetical protein [Mycobacterium lepromatosis]|uniref:hypothetical protein n=1 Tax=Mycobacterium lepromatosis TaxID=480418 RepID=UPI00138E118E|nr:hypothetical protein [Mycobacterium lepromatosis]
MALPGCRSDVYPEAGRVDGVEGDIDAELVLALGVGGAFGCMLWLWGVCLFTGPRPAGVPPAVLVPCWFHSSSSMTSQPVMTRTAVL